MNKIIASALTLTMLVGSMASAKVIPYISIRSQSENAARELVLWQTQINLFDKDCSYYGSFSVTPEYTRTFKDERLARCLFADAIATGSCCDTKCPSFKVQGSAVTDRDSGALLADNFGLPSSFSSVVNIKPKIENILVDFDFYLGLDRWYEGLYFRIHAPVVNTRWDLGFCEKNISTGVLGYPLGYFDNRVQGNPAVPQNGQGYFGEDVSDLLPSFESFVSNGQVPSLSGVTFNPLTKARMSKCRRDETKLSEIQMAFGWNFFMCDDYHVGLNIRGAAPTGSRPEGTWLFEPIVGNGKHGELGVGFTGHWTCWRNECETSDFSIYLDANVTHMFKTHQCRTFDLCGKPLSRYMLAMKMKTPAVNIADAADDATRVAPSYQFDNEYTSVANLSTIPVDVSAAVQGDVALKFAYTHCNFQFDVGYNFWGRSCEKICPRCNDCCKTADATTWALKGDAAVYAWPSDAWVAQTPPVAPLSSAAVALSSSELDATIFCGTNVFNGFTDLADAAIVYSNQGVDNAKPAFNAPAGVDGLHLINYLAGMSLAGATPINVYSSFDPYVFATNETKQWDIQAARSKGISNKVFANFGYIWKDHECWVPYLGIGGEAEFGSHCDDKCCTTPATCTRKIAGEATTSTLDCGSCSSSSNNCCTTSSNNCSTNCNNDCCTSCALSQWGVWVKGGISFN